MSKTAAPGAFCMKRIFYVLAGVSLLFALTACGGGGAMSVPSDAVAVVGDKAIPKSTFDQLLKQEAPPPKKEEPVKKDKPAKK